MSSLQKQLSAEQMVFGRHHSEDKSRLSNSIHVLKPLGCNQTRGRVTLLSNSEHGCRDGVVLAAVRHASLTNGYWTAACPHPAAVFVMGRHKEIIYETTAQDCRNIAEARLQFSTVYLKVANEVFSV